MIIYSSYLKELLPPKIGTLFILIMDNIQIMNAVIFTEQPKGITSLDIAEVTGKQHAHVMRDIRTLIEQGVNPSNFGLVEYTDKKGEKRPMYKLTPKGCLILASA